MSAPTAVADVLDRLTILELKASRIPAGPGRENVVRERAALLSCWIDAGLPEDIPERADLATVNRHLWDVEDALRRHESEQRFDDEFVQLSRSVYRLNDQRAALKRAINARFHSSLQEEKHHPAYPSG